MDLSTIREQIDSIDSQLAQLFLQRMELVEQVARYKLAHDLPVLQSDREQAVIEKAKSRAPQAMGGYMEEFFASTMAVSRHMQQDLIQAEKEKQQ